MAGMEIDDVVDLPWVEKYRPTSLDSLVAHDNIINTIRRFVSEKKLPHLLFYGPPGTGKTSTIMAVAREMYGKQYPIMTLELNASDERGIDVVRNQIKSFASTQQLFAKNIKLVILDEADAMTSAAQFALRRVIEKYTKTTRFCLICNYVSKIIPALQSRCTRFRFLPLSSERAGERIREIALNEGLSLTEDGLSAILSLGFGDMRKNVNILQSTALAFKVIDSNAVYASTGNPHPDHIQSILNLLLTNNFSDIFQHILNLKIDNGLALGDILRDLHKLLLDIEFPEKMKCFLMKQLSEIE
jgi:replication factor C subunit 3/5